MIFHVKEIKSQSYEFQTPPQDVYEIHSCPICQKFDALETIGLVAVPGKTSIESAFCTRCQHRFHKKLPNQKWIQNYYQNSFQSREKRSPFMNQLKRKLGRLVLYGLSKIPDRVYDFTSGIIKGDRSYFLRNKNIKKVLEIGCGYGGSLLAFKELGLDVYGIDASPVRVHYCRKLGMKAFLAEFDNFNNVKPFAPFDFIYSKHVLEHIVDIQSHIKGVAELLAPGGFLYIETPDLSGEFLLHQTIQLNHVQTFSLQSMGLLLAPCGFVPVRFLVDNTIQILAQKVDSELPPTLLYPSLHTIPWEIRAQYLRALCENAPCEISVQYDHYWIRMENLTTRKIIHDAALGPFSVRRLSEPVRMIFSVEAGFGKNPYVPITFQYDHLSSPPIWCKW